MNRQIIKIKKSEEIKLITPILVENGYTVRKATITKPNSKAKQTVLEYWEEENK